MEAVGIARRFPRACGIPQEFQLKDTNDVLSLVRRLYGNNSPSPFFFLDAINRVNAGEDMLQVADRNPAGMGEV